MITSQADGLLVFVTNPGTPSQKVDSLLLPSGVAVDDTAFAETSDNSLLVADKTTDHRSLRVRHRIFGRRGPPWRTRP